MRRRSKWWIGCGVALIACSLILLLTMQIAETTGRKTAAALATRMRQLLPAATVGVQDSYSSMEMPALEVDGANVIGLLEVPARGVALPIGSGWNTWKLTAYPQRFSGTVYDGSLIIGGRDSAGQLDWLKVLEIGDEIVVTDMTGARFIYAVDCVQRSKSAAARVLEEGDADLTLFARTAYGMEYVIVRCKQQ